MTFGRAPFCHCGQIRNRTGTLAFEELGGLAKVMPFAGLAFGFAAFRARSVWPGFANFSAEIMIFFGAIRNGCRWSAFHMFQNRVPCLRFGGVVISTVLHVARLPLDFLWGHEFSVGPRCRS